MRRRGEEDEEEEEEEGGGGGEEESVAGNKRGRGKEANGKAAKKAALAEAVATGDDAVRVIYAKHA